MRSAFAYDCCKASPILLLVDLTASTRPPYAFKKLYRVF